MSKTKQVKTHSEASVVVREDSRVSVALKASKTSLDKVGDKLRLETSLMSLKSSSEEVVEVDKSNKLPRKKEKTLYFQLRSISWMQSMEHNKK